MDAGPSRLPSARPPPICAAQVSEMFRQAVAALKNPDIQAHRPSPAPREPTLLFTPRPAARRHPNFLHPTISSSAQVPLAGSAALLAVGIWATAEPTTVVAAQGAKAPLKRRPSWEAKFAGGWGDTTPEIEAQLTAAMDKIGTPESGANSP